MASELNGTRVAFLTANEGVEQVGMRLPRPRRSIRPRTRTS